MRPARREPAAVMSSRNITATVLLAASMLVACGTTPVSTASRSSPSPVTTPSTALSCRLPIGGFIPSGPKGVPDKSIGADGQPNQKGTGGFLDLPSGSFTPVAGSDKSYAASAGVWLPVQPQAISPDQLSYVEARIQQSSATPPTGRLYLIDVRSRAERLLFTAPAGQMTYVLAYTSAGVFVETLSSTGPGGTADLELIDPVTAIHRAVPVAQPEINAIEVVWLKIDADAAWGMLVTNAQQPTFKLMKLSLTDGSVVDWYDVPSPFFFVGVDPKGHPILGSSADPSGTKLLVVSGPKQTAAIQVRGGSFLPGQGQSVTDRHGTWFGSADGSIWLYTAAGSFEKVATVPPQPGGSGNAYDPHAWRSVAGPCL